MKKPQLCNQMLTTKRKIIPKPQGKFYKHVTSNLVVYALDNGTKCKCGCRDCCHKEPLCVVVVASGAWHVFAMDRFCVLCPTIFKETKKLK